MAIAVREITAGAMSEAPSDLIVYAVTFMNYMPPEVIAIYDNEAAAKRHAASGEDLTVTAWMVASEYGGE